MEFRGVIGVLYKASEWIMCLSAINLLWMIGSMPVTLLLMTIFLTPGLGASHVVLLLIIATFVAPFSVFPATSAMFAVARKWVTGDVDAPLRKTFFRGYTENYKQSLAGGFIFIMIGWVFYLNYQFYSSQNNLLSAVSLILVVFSFALLTMLFYFFSIVVHLQAGIWQMMKYTVLLTFGRPLRSLGMLAGNLAILFASAHFTLAVLFFTGSLIALASFWNFYFLFKKIHPTAHER